MITRSLLVAACTVALATPAFSDEVHQHADPATPQTSAPPAKMPEMMERMQEQMSRIHATSDPKERARLMEEHMKSMHEAMPMMRGMLEHQKGREPASPE
jgi:hypothetical protein